MSLTFQFIYTVTCDTCGRTLDPTDLSLLARHPLPAQIPTPQAAISAATANGWFFTPFSVECPSCRP